MNVITIRSNVQSISDMGMPELNGIEAALRLREAEVYYFAW